MTVGLHNSVDRCSYKQPQYLVVTLATGTPVAASASNIRFTSATFYGYSAVADDAAPTANTDVVRMGYPDVANVTGVGAGNSPMITTIDQGLYTGVAAPSGSCYDLKDFVFLGSTGDKVVIVYEQ